VFLSGAKCSARENVLKVLLARAGQWASFNYLDFEEPIAKIEAEIVAAEALGDDSAAGAQTLRDLRKKMTDTTREIYDNLSPWETVQVARHKNRPHTTDYLSLVFEEFVELHGDKLFGDDRAIRAGFATVP